ncbi:MAG: hypothetical protein II800_05200 [Lachnospiraceae bacterium]|nr:hypothetical protein [Lachnospiraceae bacterium]
MGDEEKKRVREVSFSELAGDLISYKPKVVRSKEKILDDDPYFRVIDAGHDLIMQKKKGKAIVDQLPKSLQSMILELEAIMKEITLSAMEDDFDYRTQMDRYYFHMMRINSLGLLMSFKMNRFLKDRTAVEKYLSGLDKNRFPEFLRELRQFVGIGEELSNATVLFMDHLERDYTMAPEVVQKRAEELARTRELMI